MYTIKGLDKKHEEVKIFSTSATYEDYLKLCEQPAIDGIACLSLIKYKIKNGVKMYACLEKRYC